VQPFVISAGIARLGFISHKLAGPLYRLKKAAERFVRQFDLSGYAQKIGRDCLIFRINSTHDDSLRQKLQQLERMAADGEAIRQ